MSKVKKGFRSQKQPMKSPFNNYWIKENYIFLLVGIIILVLGFFLMAQDPYDATISLSISPIILLIGYIIIIPLSILYRKRNPKE